MYPPLKSIILIIIAIHTINTSAYAQDTDTYRDTYQANSTDGLSSDLQREISNAQKNVIIKIKEYLQVGNIIEASITAAGNFMKLSLSSENSKEGSIAFILSSSKSNKIGIYQVSISTLLSLQVNSENGGKKILEYILNNASSIKIGKGYGSIIFLTSSGAAAKQNNRSEISLSDNSNNKDGMGDERSTDNKSTRNSNQSIENDTTNYKKHQNTDWHGGSFRSPPIPYPKSNKNHKKAFVPAVAYVTTAAAISIATIVTNQIASNSAKNITAQTKRKALNTAKNKAIEAAQSGSTEQDIQRISKAAALSVLRISTGILYNENKSNGSRRNKGKKAKDSGKNEPHGDAGRAKKKAKKTIRELEKQLLEANTRKEKSAIKAKIKKINETASKKRKGETHHR